MTLLELIAAGGDVACVAVAISYVKLQADVRNVSNRMGYLEKYFGIKK